MIVISLPVFNEEAGLEDFLKELHEHLSQYQPEFVVVDDASTDSTPSVIESLNREGFPIHALRNPANAGHGISVVRGLTTAVSRNPQRIVLCDGDGQFNGEDVSRLVNASINSGAQVIEGVRTGRDDPWFRRFISWGTRVLVRQSSGKKALDANTPLRVLTLAAAESLLSQIPTGCPVPNLAMSAISRAQGFIITEMAVVSRPPRRNIGTSDHWKQRFRLLPSKRLVRFVLNSIVSWRAIHGYLKLGQR